MSPEVLIFTVPGDEHAEAVYWGLAQLGITTYIWFPSDFPDDASASISITPKSNQYQGCLSGINGVAELDDVKVFWPRRLSLPKPPFLSDIRDAAIVESECRTHLNGMMCVIDQYSCSINAFHSRSRADLKIYQLIWAIKSGLTILDTLFSNSAYDVTEFIGVRQVCVGKAHKPAGWQTQEGQFSQLTYVLPDSRDIHPQAIAACPIIVQPLVEREYEVRVIIFGSSVHVVRTCDARQDGHIDGRYQANLDNFESYVSVNAPDDVIVGCKKYMSALDLKFGAFDFIIDSEGNWLFLECNEAGQFLFIEQIVSSINLLDDFCKWIFLKCKGTEYVGDVQLKLADFCSFTENLDYRSPVIASKDIPRSSRFVDERTFHFDH